MPTFTEINANEFSLLAQDPKTIVIDVREAWEFEEFNEGGINIPLATIREKLDLLIPFENIVVICTNGLRSQVAARDYGRSADFSSKKIFHLKGGILEAE